MNYFTGFPLYSTLIKEVEDDTITLVEKQYIMNNIKKLDKQDYEYLYCLIVSYYIDHNKKNVKEIIPFDGKQLKTGVKFNLEDLPNKLQKIIYIFITKIYFILATVAKKM